MDKEVAAYDGYNSKNSTTWEKRQEFEDGTSITECVEQVSNGFIKKVTKNYKDGDEWKYECIKSIHKENPLEKKSLVDKLEEILKG